MQKAKIITLSKVFFFVGITCLVFLFIKLALTGISITKTAQFYMEATQYMQYAESAEKQHDYRSAKKFYALAKAKLDQIKKHQKKYFTEEECAKMSYYYNIIAHKLAKNYSKSQ